MPFGRALVTAILEENKILRDGVPAVVQGKLIVEALNIRP